MGWTAAPLQLRGSGNHSSNIPRTALPFSSINSFNHYKSGRRVSAAIHEEIGANFNWPDALPDAKPTFWAGPLSVDGQTMKQ